MTGRKFRAIRSAANAALALVLASCGSASSGNTNYSQFYQLMRQSVSASFGNVRVTREQAAAVPYASMGYALDGGNQIMLVLATDSGGEMLWTSAAHVVIVTRQGRIVRTVGLGHDLSGLTTRNSGTLPAPSAAIQRISHAGIGDGCRLFARDPHIAKTGGDALAHQFVELRIVGIAAAGRTATCQHQGKRRARC